jgi:hypothetical protein
MKELFKESLLEIQHKCRKGRATIPESQVYKDENDGSCEASRRKEVVSATLP